MIAEAPSGAFFNIKLEDLFYVVLLVIGLSKMQNVDHKLAEIRNKFRTYYDTELKHKYVELEPARKKYFKWFCFLFILFLGAFFGLF